MIVLDVRERSVEIFSGFAVTRGVVLHAAYIRPDTLTQDSRAESVLRIALRNASEITRSRGRIISEKRLPSGGKIALRVEGTAGGKRDQRAHNQQT